MGADVCDQQSSIWQPRDECQDCGWKWVTRQCRANRCGRDESWDGSRSRHLRSPPWQTRDGRVECEGKRLVEQCRANRCGPGGSWNGAGCQPLRSPSQRRFLSRIGSQIVAVRHRESGTQARSRNGHSSATGAIKALTGVGQTHAGSGQQSCAATDQMQEPGGRTPQADEERQPTRALWDAGLTQQQTHDT